jgi:hypothetical protein
MQRDSATAFSLRPYKGNIVEVDEEKLIVPSAGLSRAPADNLISSTGTDSGGAMAASTLYYVYVSNSKASFSPSSIRASATAPSAFNGIESLAASGNGLNWRFVGWIRTDGSTQIVDTVVDRLVINYYNRRPLPIQLRPGYVNDGLQTSFSLNSTTWVALNGGTGATASYIANGEDAVEFNAAVTIGAQPSATMKAGIGDNSTTTVSTAAAFSSYTAAIGIETRTAHFKSTPAAGYRTVSLIGHVSTGTFTILADLVRNGSASDPEMTYLYGVVQG